MTTIDYKKQALDFLEKTGTTFKIAYVGYGSYFDDDKEKKQSRNVYRFTFSRGKLGENYEEYSGKFGDSIENSKHGRVRKYPSVYNVLTCLTKYDPGTFDDFCLEFGYDTDSRRAEKTYKAVVIEWENVDRLWHDCLELLREVQ